MTCRVASVQHLKRDRNVEVFTQQRHSVDQPHFNAVTVCDSVLTRRLTPLRTNYLIIESV